MLLFISPLLALASDQMQKLRGKTAITAHLGSYHLGKMKMSAIKIIAEDISHMIDLPTGNWASSMILFASSHFLVGTRGKPILGAVLSSKTSALHAAIMDEARTASQC